MRTLLDSRRSRLWTMAGLLKRRRIAAAALCVAPTGGALLTPTESAAKEGWKYKRFKATICATGASF
jgi:hypothetical protein